MKTKNRRILPFISLAVIIVILCTDLPGNTQSTLLTESAQCSISPIARVEQKLEPSKGTKTASVNKVVNTKDENILLKVSKVTTDFTTGELKSVSLGDKVRVYIEGIDKAINQGYSYNFNQDSQTRTLTPFNYKNLVLQLDGYPLNHIHGTSISNNELEFELTSDADSHPQWSAILGNASKIEKDVRVSVGCPNGQAVSQTQEFILKITLWNLVRFFWILLPLIILVLSIFLCFRDGGLLRTSGITAKRCYSLAKTQLAWWFYIIFFSFLSLFVITGSYTNIVTSQSMVLLGIGSLTTLGSSIIDNVSDEKNLDYDSDKNSQIQTLEDKRIKIESSRMKSAEKKKELLDNKKQLNKYELQSINILQDVVTDSSGQVNIHRYQIVIWTILLGFIFLYQVINTYKMPEFDTTLLALQGISSGTYLTLKASRENNETNQNNETNSSREEVKSLLSRMRNS